MPVIAMPSAKARRFHCSIQPAVRRYGARLKKESGTGQRRGGARLGTALEILGHAVEYLVDSRLFDMEDAARSDAEAVRVLMRCSRKVFAECPGSALKGQQRLRLVEGRPQPMEPRGAR